MLAHLLIRDMLLIERLEIPFEPGLNVLTGETGSGKSILLDCLGFTLGWKGRADILRPGAQTGEVEAIFHLGPDHPGHTALAEAGLPPAEDGQLILRRQITAEGRRTAWVNDRRATAEALRGLAVTLVELHGQNDDHGLMNPRAHRMLLDAFAGNEAQLAQVRTAWRALQSARAAATDAAIALAAAQRDEEFLRHACAELDQLAPEPGEEALLDTRRRQMQAATRIREDVHRALTAVSEDGAEGLLIDAQRRLDTVAASASEALDGGLEAPLAALGRALVELGEAHAGIEACLRDLDIDPRALEEAEERLFAIRALARKHTVATDDLADLADTLRRRLAALDRGAGTLAEAEAAVVQAQTAYITAARTLSAQRKETAQRLDAAMALELPPLRLEKARFATQVRAGTEGPEGCDEVSFLVATNAGLDAGALEQIASGGEQSRFLLALKVCLAAGRPNQTLIFDEIDRGVGGATADAVGRRLERLADRGQVLVVTHSPQVAARGAHHLRVEKVDLDGVTQSRVVALPRDERVDEIARMLAGERITEAAQAAARALIDG